MSPLTFTISAISQPMVGEYEVTMSLESANNFIGTYVVCFSAETNKRYCKITKSEAYNHLNRSLSCMLLVFSEEKYVRNR